MQLTFNLRRPDSYLIEEFIVSTCNQHAFETISQFPRSFGYNPYPSCLLIDGPPSCGKTYLAHIWAHPTHAYFISHHEECTQIDLQNNNYFVVEDINKHWQEEKLFHLFNMLTMSGKYLLMTSTNIDKSCCFSLPDLSSRITSLATIYLEHPDDSLLHALLFKLFFEEGVVIQQDAISFILERMTRRIDLLQKIVVEINNFALSRGKCITRRLLQTFWQQYSQEYII
ncbi:Chromosomal replication initiator protein DnaA-like protein [Rickettsiales endosymbiont of Paramecium tredecaurelia]|uniref:DnaA ATPase domain-containing protein n=1 Tax=Candidatus Sarmatiella mevalonica TaxID=2770581 RepID=UPI001922B1C8|nr:DnaA/Hda family protein [Candidatus Sarmatiella mevalonica]MBL3284558.1 Chromosomal replication initiator protein DnaA-like protein [Candidatus Sarmatiella mevalonica]